MDKEPTQKVKKTQYQFIKQIITKDIYAVYDFKEQTESQLKISICQEYFKYEHETGGKYYF